MAATATATLTASLASRSCAVSFDQLSAADLELVRQALIDWFGVTLGGCREPGPGMLLETLGGERAEGSPAATVLGRARRLPARDAALVNGTASHVLDFDDVNLLLPGHVSVALLAAALALGEQLDAHGTELIAAFVAGYETACRVALAVGRDPYQRGFHATGTIGVFGAAAACARLLALDAEATARALGIAASEAAGLKCNMGTMTKSLHAGRACESGLLAASLAARGFTAAPDALEAEQGFTAVCGGRCDLAAALAEPANGLHLHGNLFKHHAACWFTHSAIEGATELRERHGIEAGRIRRVVLHVSEVERGACTIGAPVTGLEVKFSIAHLTAMALLGRDTVAIGEDAAFDAATLALRDRVELAGDGRPGAPTCMEVDLDDGGTLTAEHDVDAPERDLDRQRARLERKFSALSEPVLGAGGAAHLLALLGAAERSRVRELAAVAAAAGPGASA